MEYIIDKIREYSKKTPNKKAIIFGNYFFDYLSFYNKICSYTSYLKTIISRGDNIGLIAWTSPETVALYFAIQECGCTVVLLDKMLSTEIVKKRCEEINIKEIVSYRQSKEKNYIVPDESICGFYDKCVHNCDDISDIIFTSGSTSSPKGVMLSYKAIYSTIKNNEMPSFSNDIVKMVVPPLHHGFAMASIRNSLFNGETVVLESGITFIKKIEDDIKINNCNAISIVPSQYEMIKTQMGVERFKSVFNSFELIQIGAGALNVKQRKEIVSFLPNTQIFNSWATSETGNVLIANINELVKDEKIISSLGYPAKGVSIKILDEEKLTEIKGDKDNPGIIAVNSKSSMSGYYGFNQISKVTIDNEDYIIIKDLVYKDQNGYYFMLGRSDDIINCGGEKIAPIEIEESAYKYENIKECVCIGVDDPDGLLGKIPVLFVTAKSGYDKKELIKILTNNLGKLRLPREYVVVEQFPITNNGKIDKTELINMFSNIQKRIE